MRQLRKGVNIIREGLRWGALTIALLGFLWILFADTNSISAIVSNNGLFFYGDTDAASQGVLRARTFNPTATVGAEFNGATASSTSFIVWTIAKAAPTRDEMTIGTLKVNGTLDIQTCNGGCNSTADFTARWNNPGTTVTQQCDTTPVVDQCVRTFDIGYESLSGRAFVAYADNVADAFYYARWNGSSWSPNASPGTPGASNVVSLPGAANVPNWIRVVPSGDGLANDRSNRVMVLVSDLNDDLFAFYWDGTSFDSGTTIATDLQNCGLGQCFDGNWQGINNFILSYGDADGVNDIKYNKFTVGSGWAGEVQAYTTNSIGQWVVSTADSTSSRIMVATSAAGEDTRNAVWRGDDATDGWTVGCTDTTTETVSGMQAYAAFERFNGEGLHVFNDSGTATTSDYCAYTPPGTWGVAATLGLTSGDDNEKIKAWGSPNNDNIMIMNQDVDCDTDAKLWTGAGLGALMASIEVDNSHYGVACPNNTAPQASPEGAAYSFDYAWKMYTPWQRNWRFYDGADTASTPTTALATENTAPSAFGLDGGIFRLRINYADRGNLNSTDSRRKLQFTTGCNPNSVLEASCTWTDVDNPGGTGVWRYKDLTCTVTDCADNTLLVGTVLSGSSACALGSGCGTWILDKDAAAGTNMDHNGVQVQESEWIVESNWPVENSTYYFRIWDAQQATPVYREQDSADCGAGGVSTCTYPTILTGDIPPPTVDQVMRHGNWFSNGIERRLYWAD